jgi:hypothetical protein
MFLLEPLHDLDDVLSALPSQPPPNPVRNAR